MPFNEELAKQGALFYYVPEGETPPLMGDGKTYSRALGWQSPEGNFYGQVRWVRDWYSIVVWDGEDYRLVELDGAADSIDKIPVPRKQHFEIWGIPRANWPPKDVEYYDARDKDFVYWDAETQTLKPIELYWDIEGEENLPRPGLHPGSAHIIVYHDVRVMWNGYYWQRYKHSMLEDDEPWLHVPEGFIQSYENQLTSTSGAIQLVGENLNQAVSIINGTISDLSGSVEEQFQEAAEQLNLSVDEFRSKVTDARMEFTSKTSLGLFPSVRGKVGALWVNGELLLTDNVMRADSTNKAVIYSNDTITKTDLLPNTEYNVYCGNSLFADFPVSLFLSLTSDVNGHLGVSEPGSNARIVGVVETDSAGYFVREIDMSLIGKKIEFSQTYWEYADYQLQFVDEDTLEFKQIDGTSGLCYVNGQLLNLGTGRELSRDAYRIEWNNGPDLDTEDILPSTLYQIYIANDSGEYNFNVDGPDGYPLDEGDQGYVWQLDFRRRLFLSTKEHDHRLFDQEYPGYYARHIGQVLTDSSGYFKYSSDISLIRQPTLNPTSLDGLAECVIQDVSTSQFKVIRKKGTTGIVYVGGRPVQTYDTDNPLVHIVNTSDYIYTYTEANINSPLASSGFTVASKPGISIYLYLANSISSWGGKTTFCSLTAPTGGYLSANWPGNNARWIATIQLAPDTTGSEKVANGAFTSDSSWTKGTGWAWSSPNQNMVHTPGNSATLSQNVSVTANVLYACTFYISGRTAGIAAPKIGGASGLPITGNTSSTQYLLAATTGDLEIVPDTYFDGAVDNISVKQVTSGKFAGTYIKDSVSGISAQIDDGIVSSSTTYSSNKIEQIRQQLLTKINLALGLNGSHTAGLDLVLEYVDSSTIKLKANSTDVDVIFPNLETVTVTTAGITKTVSGSTETLYYVYLVTDSTLAIITDAPTDNYASISFYGETHVLVGWLGCSDTDTITGTHNVYSFWNEPTRTYTESTSSFPHTFSLSGVVIPEGKEGTIEWSGSIVGRSVMSIYPAHQYVTEVNATTTEANLLTETVTNYSETYWDDYGSSHMYIDLHRDQEVSLSPITISPGVSNVEADASYTTLTWDVISLVVDYNPDQNYSITHNPSMTTGDWYHITSDYVSSCSGTITITRPGNQ